MRALVWSVLGWVGVNVRVKSGEECLLLEAAV